MRVVAAAIREDLEKREREVLAPQAAKSADSRGRVRPEDEDPIRPAFQRDRDRIIHAHAFRKLQSKTQVFLSGEYDFYRTRLTHSMEVAQIGRSICAYLFSRGAPWRPDFFIDSDLVEAVCLAHDLGHPPFGHSGERTLQELMVKWGGFEGNAQTLHLLTETIYHDEAGVRGMAATRALLDGVLKYKKLFREFPAPPTNHFLYDPQERHRAFVFGEADDSTGVAVISLARLRPRGERGVYADALLRRRASTEAIHEVGHCKGLRHCDDDRCVMWFSNTVAESDRKGIELCARHARELRRVLLSMSQERDGQGGAP